MNLDNVRVVLDLDFPAIILVVLLALGLFVLWRTQKTNDAFDFADMLRDDSGKPSSSRMAVFVCLAISTWALMYMIIVKKGDLDPWIFISYIAIWSGAKVAEKGLDAYIGNVGYPGAPKLTTVRRQTVEDIDDQYREDDTHFDEQPDDEEFEQDTQRPPTRRR